jgi:hypothetical protein
MSFDPFADEETPQQEDTPTTEKKEKKTVSEDINEQAAGITISHKPNDRYDSALIVIKGGSPTDALGTYRDPNLRDLISVAAQVDVYIKQTFAEVAPKDNPAPQTRSTPRNTGNGGETRDCKHGTMVLRSGSKNGRPWTGFFCPAPKDDPTRCSPQFLRD